MLLGITGYKQVGKDTVLEYLQDNTHTVNYSFALPIYSMLTALCGNLPRNKDGSMDKDAVVQPFGVTLRHLLQTLGTEWGRELIHSDIWVLQAQHWLDTLSGLDNTADFIVFSDVRFANEATFIKRNGGKILEVRRKGYNGDSHKSEEGLPAILIDQTVHNDSDLLDLYSSIDRAIESL